MTVHALQSNFSRGAITPLLYARHDKDWYSTALAELVNFLVLKFGVIRRASGTRFCGEAKYHNKSADFRPFIFSSTQVFFLEFGDLYVRFWTVDGEQVLSGESPVEVVTTYPHTDVDRLQIVQNGDYLFIAHPDHPPKQLRRVSNTNWQFSSIVFEDGPYLPINDTAVTCDPSANPTVGGSLTLTFSSASAINGGDGFTNADIGRRVRVLCTTWCWFEITAVTNTTTVTVTSKSAGASHAAVTSWRLGAFGATPGYPGSVEFFKGRLVWSRTKTRPKATWPSMVGLPFRYDPSLPDGTVNDDHAFMIESLSSSAEEILWLKEAAELQVGTASSIRTIAASDDTAVFSPRSYTDDLAVDGGTIPVPPVSAGSSTVHAGRFGLSLNDLYYDYQSNGLVAPDISALSEHLLRPGVKKLAYQRSPSGIIWALLHDGTWVGATYERYERIIGLHAHSTREGDAVESICTAPDQAHKRDAMIMLVRRTVNEATVRYVEMLQPEFQGQSMADAWFLDCAARYEGELTDTVAGLDHLAGEVVSLFADGATYPNVVVSQDGEIELPNAAKASKILVGLPKIASAKILRMNVDGRDGSLLGRKKRTPYVILDVLETSGVKVAPVATGKYETFRFRNTMDPMNTSPPLYTGTGKKVVEDSGSQDEIDGQITILCDQPLPATIRAFNVGYDFEP